MRVQSCPTLCNPTFVHGIFLARILECIAISFSRGFPNPLASPALIGGFFITVPPGKL